MKSIISIVAIILFSTLKTFADISVETLYNETPHTRPVSWSVSLKITVEEKMFIDPLDFWTRVVNTNEEESEVASQIVSFSGQVDTKDVLILEPKKDYIMTLTSSSPSILVPGQYYFQIYNIHYTKEGAGGFEEGDHEIDIRSSTLTIKPEKIAGPDISVILILGSILIGILVIFYRQL